MQILHYLPFLFPLLPFALLFLASYIQSKNNDRLNAYLLKNTEGSSIKTIPGIKADVYRSGRAEKSKHFSRCTLYILPNAVFITTQYRLFWVTFTGKPLLVTTDRIMYADYISAGVLPEWGRINPDSFGKQVYLEYGTSSFTGTNIEIYLKGLTDEERDYFRFKS